MAKQDKKIDEVEESELKQTIIKAKKSIFMARLFR